MSDPIDPNTGRGRKEEGWKTVVIKSPFAQGNNPPAPLDPLAPQAPPAAAAPPMPPPPSAPPQASGYPPPPSAPQPQFPPPAPPQSFNPPPPQNNYPLSAPPPPPRSPAPAQGYGQSPNPGMNAGGPPQGFPPPPSPPPPPGPGGYPPPPPPPGFPPPGGGAPPGGGPPSGGNLPPGGGPPPGGPLYQQPGAPPPKKKGKGCLWAVIIVVVLLVLVVLVVGGVGWYAYSKAKNTPMVAEKKLHLLMSIHSDEAIYDDADINWQQQVTREQSDAMFDQVYTRLGKPIKSTQLGSTPPLDANDLITVQYSTQFDNGTAVETIVFHKTDKGFKLFHYAVDSTGPTIEHERSVNP